MTIVPTHTITSNAYPQKSSLKSIRINGAVAELNNGHVNGAETPPPAINTTDRSLSDAPASLLARFLNTYKELASYK